MNVEELLRDTLREQAGEQVPAGPGFADRVLAARRRRRGRRLASVAAATAAVVAVAVAVPLLDSGKDDVRPAGVVEPDGIGAHPDQSPPRDMIAAGRVALAAYWTARTVPRAGDADTAVFERTYRLLDPRTGTYEKDSRWSRVAVAPGLRTAAVLERDLPVRRIGLLDLASGQVERWVPVDHAVGGLAFSADGTKLVATTYDGHPDELRRLDGDQGSDWGPLFGGSTRTGFTVLDVASGTGTWVAVPRDRHTYNGQDFAFGHGGRTVYCQVVGERDGLSRFYDLAGNEIAAPANERHLRSDVGARLSPDGTLAAWGLTKEVAPGKSYSSIRDPRTGKEIAKVRGGRLLAWVDDKRLIAWERVTGLEEPYRPRLVLVTIGSDKVVPLSGVREQDTDMSRHGWEPVFAER
ncbi:WD40 repeat domain-containing protein [Streptomyces sp. DH24]|uniref:WD40 repeat domain-containing protein n=1 Tax=Streptomyces sp. DH24 TaxID=3040123 RepID=UPI0024437214|nr:WD40 repeat domain-containing protein [Streptomyces sp. DH24]MDG9715152.1 WD40 repeat domain-containing protein [Streptomyces sp. DH24]